MYLARLLLSHLAWVAVLSTWIFRPGFTVQSAAGRPLEGENNMRGRFLAFLMLAAGSITSTPICAQSWAPVPNPGWAHVNIARLTQQANDGNGDAQFRLGLAYELGLGVEKSIGYAIAWYQKAADHGVPGAENNLAILYETWPEGFRVPHQDVKTDSTYELYSRHEATYYIR